MLQHVGWIVAKKPTYRASSVTRQKLQSIHVTRYAMQTASCLTEIVPRGSGSLRPLAEPTSSGLCRNEPAQAESAYGPGSLDDGRQECP